MPSEVAAPGPRSASLEHVLTGLDKVLAESEARVDAALKAIRRLRRAAREGELAGLSERIGEAAKSTAQAALPLSEAGAGFGYDLATSFRDGAYLSELEQAAEQAGLKLVRRDGRITAYPVVLRLDARSQGVRIGRKLERRIRPSVLIATLKRLQSRPDRFNARSFLDRLLKPYTLFAHAITPGWRAGKPGEGPLVPLADLHEQLTVLPAAAADYPIEEFLCDLLRLDRDSGARSSRGYRFELAAATGTRGSKRLTVFDEQGEQHDYFAIRFALDA